MNRNHTAEIITKAINTYGTLSIDDVDMDATIDNLEKAKIATESDDYATLLAVLIFVKLKNQKNIGE